MMMKKIIVLMVYFILVFINLAYGKTLELVTLEYPPYEYTENRKIKGIAVDIVKEAFRRMNQTINITVLPWARAINMIEHSKADAIFTAYKNQQRELFADYSKEVLMYQTMSFFVKKGSPIIFDGNIGSLKNYMFGTVIKVSYGKKFDDAKNNKILDKIVETSSVRQNILMLTHGRIDIWVNNKYGGLFELKKMNLTHKVAELHPEVEKIPSYIAFSKKRKLSVYRDKFDTILAQMKKEGTYDEIIQAFFN